MSGNTINPENYTLEEIMHDLDTLGKKVNPSLI